MKKIIAVLVLLFNIGISMAQAPNMFNYQGVARTANNQVMANKTIKLKLSVRTQTGTGTTIYSETRSVTTNENGLFNVNVGSPGALTYAGTLAGVDWSAHQRWLQTEMDPNNGNTFTNLGAVQILSVPYAISALKADNLKLPYAVVNTNAGSILSITNTQGTAIQGAAYGQGTGVNASTDNGIGVLSLSNNLGTAIYGRSNKGIAGRFLAPAGNTSHAVFAEQLGGGTAIQANATGQGVGVSATTDNNIGIMAKANNVGTAIYATSQAGNVGKFESPATNNKTTLQGINSGAGIGVGGSSVTGDGVYGFSKSKSGVFGMSNTEIGVKGNSTSGTGVSGYSQTGTAGYFSAPFGGKALETNGSVKMTGQTMGHGHGKVLTSDENGFANWKGPIAFKGSGLTGTSVPGLGIIKPILIHTATIVTMANEEYDYGTAYDKAIFTAPETGLYHFNAGILFAEQTYNTPLEEGFIRIVKKRADGSKVHLASIALTEFTELHNGVLSVDAIVLEDEKVFVEIYVAVVDPVATRYILNKPSQTNNWFSGHLISRI